jgi:hypothetical protein
MLSFSIARAGEQDVAESPARSEHRLEHDDDYHDGHALMVARCAAGSVDCGALRLTLRLRAPPRAPQSRRERRGRGRHVAPAAGPAHYEQLHERASRPCL